MSQRQPPQPIGILPHPEFMRAVDNAQYEAYKADPRIRVTSLPQFREMQSHIKRLYEGVEVQSSFVDASGHVFDCIPIDQQPSLRAAGQPVAQPPDLSEMLPPDHAPEVAPAQSTMQLSTQRKDRNGNMMGCPPGTIPVRRVTLDQIARYPTLQDFFRKVPPPTAVLERTRPQPTAPDPNNEANNHRYAYTNQVVDNLGGHSFLNIWQPNVVTPDQRMSLSQQWYAGGDPASIQTAEVGWQVLPDKYGHSQPVLFIYWTADGYKATGNYNLDAAAFVQTSPNWAIGGAIGPISTDGGQQYEIEVAFYLANDGNWWLYLGGVDSGSAVGYYPTSIYNGGQMATNAQSIEYGGETVCHAIGWGDMGSGQYAATGYGHAAYQRDIFYYPTAGGSQTANLIAQEPSPGCYTVNLASAADPWNIYFFFGGPGGSDC